MTDVTRPAISVQCSVLALENLDINHLVTICQMVLNPAETETGQFTILCQQSHTALKHSGRMRKKMLENTDIDRIQEDVDLPYFLLLNI